MFIAIYNYEHTYSENNSAYFEFSEEQIKYSNTATNIILDVYYCMKMVLCNFDSIYIKPNQKYLSC